MTIVVTDTINNKKAEVYELGNLKQVEEYLLACSDENSIMQGGKLL